MNWLKQFRQHIPDTLEKILGQVFKMRCPTYEEVKAQMQAFAREYPDGIPVSVIGCRCDKYPFEHFHSDKEPGARGFQPVFLFLTIPRVPHPFCGARAVASCVQENRGKPGGNPGTSMIGKCQGKGEISLHLMEGLPKHGVDLDCVCRTALDSFFRPTLKQRGQTSICGNSPIQLSTKIEIG